MSLADSSVLEIRANVSFALASIASSSLASRRRMLKVQLISKLVILLASANHNVSLGAAKALASLAAVPCRHCSTRAGGAGMPSVPVALARGNSGTGMGLDDDASGDPRAPPGGHHDSIRGAAGASVEDSACVRCSRGLAALDKFVAAHAAAHGGGGGGGAAGAAFAATPFTKVYKVCAARGVALPACRRRGVALRPARARACAPDLRD